MKKKREKKEKEEEKEEEELDYGDVKDIKCLVEGVSIQLWSPSVKTNPKV